MGGAFRVLALEALGTNEGEDQVDEEEQRHRASEDEIEQHGDGLSELVADGNVGKGEGEKDCADREDSYVHGVVLLSRSVHDRRRRRAAAAGWSKMLGEICARPA